MWAKIGAEDKEVTYDGKEHFIDDASLVLETGSLDQKYVDQIQKMNKVQLSQVQYQGPADGTYTAEPKKYTDADQYEIHVKGTVTVDGAAHELTTSATLT